ncbi:gliding motility-associated-like protein [Lutibacter sp. Hel_I_33_5]|uniref:tandem-95 repeat protein n=1 Tax=Lutibacter sp. Hel_I_33_5 TaxID=1566289 RepID=UPI0011A0C9A5|nr:Ig-like domain-containing protein [Lutibacter sp. Hel_I_33_5]TVZ56571.1 gliding motility-associated-like protein [Lutibacter sp. Hel_I_33_5]
MRKKLHLLVVLLAFGFNQTLKANVSLDHNGSISKTITTNTHNSGTKFLSINPFFKGKRGTCLVAAVSNNYYLETNVQEKTHLISALEKQSANKTFHLFTHGKSGELFINNKWLNASQIAEFLKEKNLLKNNKHLNIYGCEFAKGEKGEKAVLLLEHELKIIISASTNITGKKGDWILETNKTNTSVQPKNYNYSLQCAGTVGGKDDGDDFDGDGICNDTDLDDDNDGVLDTDECGLSTGGGQFLTHLTDIVQSSFHSVIVKTGSEFTVHGENSRANGTSDHLVPTPITSANSYNYTGTPLHATLGSNGDAKVQFALMTTTGLYVWGNYDVFSSVGNSFQSLNMPPSVSPTDVKKITASSKAIMILTNSGDVWVLNDGANSINAVLGNGGDDQNDDTIWKKANLTSVKEVRYNGRSAFALTNSGDLYTWGRGGYLGNGTGIDDEDGLLVPTLMTNPLPSGVTAIQIATSYSAEVSASVYYVLGSNGKVYSLGANNVGQLGIGSNITESRTWVTVQNPAGTADLDNVVFLSAQDNDGESNATASVLLSDKSLLSWGFNDERKIVGLDNDIERLPSIPNGTASNTYDLVENGGHLTPLISASGDYCNVGHNSNGAFGDGTTTNRSSYICNNINNFTVDTSVPTCNTDNDADENRFDLDSDGDGCSDALEAGATTDTTADYKFPDVDTNNDGLVDAVDNGANGGTANDGTTDYTLTYAKAIDNTLKDCTDTDGDGVLDGVDLDDDNDGVLDTVENMCSSFVNGNSTTGSVGVDLESNSTGAILAEGTTATNANSAYLRANDILVLTLPSEIATGGVITLSMADRNGSGTITVTDEGTGSLSVTSWTAEDQLQYFSFTVTAPTDVLTFTRNTGSVWVDGVSTCQTSNFLDIDNDGIINSLDLDSDGDGCPDTLEAGVPTNNSDLLAATVTNGNGTDASANTTSSIDNAQLNANGTDTNNDGLNDSVDNTPKDGTPDYAPSYAANALDKNVQGANCPLPACSDPNKYADNCDFDGDGIVNSLDLDDDNDGVLDTEEKHQNCVVPPSETCMVDRQFDQFITWIEVDPTDSNKLLGELVVEGVTIDVSLKFPTGINAVIGIQNHPPYFDDPTGFCPATPDITKRKVPQITKAGDYKLTFSEAVLSPRIHIWSLGGLGVTPIMTFNQQVTLEKNFSLTQLDSFKIQAQNNPSQGGNGTLEVNGAQTELNFNFDRNETWFGFSVSTIPFAGSADLLACNIDTDNDGVPNHFDLDSDGDGCPDALEAGVPANNVDFQSATVTNGNGTDASANTMSSINNAQLNPSAGNTNGLNTSVDSGGDGTTDYTSTYTTYALDKDIQGNNCPCPDPNHYGDSCDFDGDGVSNRDDLDDDNDGVLDTDECNPVGTITSFKEYDGKWLDDDGNVAVSLTANNDTFPQLVADKDDDGQLTVNTNSWSVGQTLPEELSLPLTVAWHKRGDNSDFFLNIFPYANIGTDDPAYTLSTALSIQSNTGLGAFTWGLFGVGVGGWNGLDDHDFKIEVFDAGNGTSTAQLWSRPSGGTYTMHVEKTGLPIQTWALAVGYLADINLSITSPTFSEGPTCDTDGDGIYNHFDLDSDKDGCSDALEAGATTNATANFQFPNVDANNDGLVDAVDNGANGGTANDGTTDYTSTYSNALDNTIKDCTDTDKDGILDTVDLDDDNDGILDTVEGSGDIDGDGIINSLDSDSDGDGCFDALEGSENYTEANLTDGRLPSTGVNPNGQVDGINQIIGDSQNDLVKSCPCPFASGIDTDGDGIDNRCDLDSDNDGILDTEESCQAVTDCLTQNYAGFDRTAIITPITTDITLQTGAIANVIDGAFPDANSVYYTNGEDIANKSLYEFTTACPILINRIRHDHGTANTNTFLSNGSKVILQAYDNNSGTWKPISNEFTASGSQINAAGGGEFITTTNLKFLANKFRLYGISGTTVNTKLEEIYIDRSTELKDNVGICDTDSDGIPDNLDLDSDGDGCFDAVEGAGTYTEADLTDGELPSTGTNPNGQIDGTNQTKGDSQNALLKSCVCPNPSGVDSDNDGIDDACDLDDDNDGILDVDEGGGGDCSPVFRKKTTVSSSGSGTSGIPTMTYEANPKLGKKLIFIVSIERDHTPTPYGDNYEEINSNPLTNGATIPDLKYGTTTIRKRTGAQSAFKKSGLEAKISNSLYIYELSGTDIPSGIQNIDFTDFSIPSNSGDEMIVTILEYDNVSSIEVDSGSAESERNVDGGISPIEYNFPISIPSTATTFPVGGSLSDNHFLAISTSSTEALIATAENNWKTISVRKVTNTAGSYGQGSDLTNSTENDGLNTLIQYETGITAQSNLTHTVANGTESYNRAVLNLIGICPQDTDSDNIPDYLDLDSDADGCFDAVEGNGTFVESNLTSGRLTGADANKDGVIDTITTQTIGESRNAAITACSCPNPSGIDSDNDGIDDKCDLDDDNDGILDAVECPTLVANATQPLGYWHVSYYDGHFGVTNVDGIDSNNDKQSRDANNVLGNQPELRWTSTTDSSSNNYMLNAGESNEQPDGSNTAVTGDINSTSPYNNPIKTFIAHSTTLLPGTYVDPMYSADGKGTWVFVFKQTMAANATIQIGVEDETIDDYVEVFVNGVLESYIDGYEWKLPASEVINQSVQAGDVVEIRLTNGSSAGGFIMNITTPSSTGVACVDTDNDSIPNYLDSDSDGDGCNDVLESGGVDTTPADGKLDGTGFDSDGKVTGGSGGYDGVTGKEIIASKVTVDAATPANRTVRDTVDTSLTVTASAENATAYSGGTPTYGTANNGDSDLRYQWYLGDPASGGTALTNTAPYGGVTTNTLAITGTPLSLNGNVYYVEVTHQNNSCFTSTTSATLTVEKDTDEDGVSDVNDLDDDNDGILDTVEGTGDIDDDGIANDKDLDSDGDGCKDSIESGGIDANNDGLVDGDGVNAMGQVTTSGAILATSYNGATGDEIIAVKATALASTPSSTTTVEGNDTNFTVSASAESATAYSGGTPTYGTANNADSGLRYTWYLGDPSGSGVALTDAAPYGGTTTKTLTITGTPLNLNGKEYFVTVTHANNACFTATSSASLSVTAANVGPDTNAVTSPTISTEAGATLLPPPTGTDTDGTIAGYIFTNLPTGGSLQYTEDGTGTIKTVTEGEELSVAEANTLTFDPAGTTSTDQTFTVAAKDDDGVTDTSGATYTIPLNAPPTTDNKTAPAISSSAGPTALPTFTANDPDGSVAGYVIKTLPSGGVLQYTEDGTGTIKTVTSSEELSPTEVATLTFDPDGTSNVNTSFTLAAKDNEGLEDASPATISIPLANTPPIAAEDTYTTPEEMAVTLMPLTGDSDPDGGTVSITKIGGTTLTGNAQTITLTDGVVTIDASGVISFTPKDDFNGLVTIPYEITDGQGETTTSNQKITVTVVNDAPIAVEDTYTTNEETPVTLLPLTGDSDIDGGTLSVTKIGGVALTGGAQTITLPEGVVTIDASGAISFDPKDDFNGLATIPYEISDGQGGTATSNQKVTVNAVNDAPVANNDAKTISEDQTGTIDVVSNDTDVDGTINKASVDLDPSTPGQDTSITTPEGTWSVDTNGVVTFDPKDDFNGTATLPYTVKDDSGTVSNQGTITMSVTPENDPPVANADSATTTEDVNATVNIITNDTDLEGAATIDKATIDLDPNTAGVQDSITTPEGVWTVDGNGLLTFDPVDNYNGTASITYTVKDDQGAESNSGAVSVVVSAVNDAPVATNDAIGTNPNTPVIIPVLTNDNDVDGDDLTVSLITTNPTKGSVMINPDGTITYTPNAGFINGTDSFEYRVCDTSNACDTATVTVSVPNTPLSPTANPDTNTVAEGGTVSVPTLGVLANDTDANLDGLTVVGIKIGAQTFTVGQPATIAGKGTITINSDGSYEFTALGDFNGAFPEITYTVSDGTSTADSEGTLNITVTPVNDAPVANNDAVTIDEDATATVNVATNDTDVDGAIDPSTVDLDPSSPGVQNTLTTPEGVWSVNTSGVVTFDPVDNFNGTASLPYTIKDNNGLESTTPGTITVTVNSVNDAPVATNDTVTVDEDTNATIDVTANDTDSDGTIDKTTVDLDPTTSGVQNTITTPEGVWSVDANGIVTFDPKDDFNGTASLPYNVKDNGGTISNNGTITVTVDPVNDAPVANNDAKTISEDQTGTIDVVSNDTDVDGTINKASVDLDPSTPGQDTSITTPEGTWSVDTNGVVTFDPKDDFNGTATLPYTVKDDSGTVSNQGTITMSVTPENDPPVANTDSATTTEDVNATVNIITNDTDLEGAATIDKATIDLDPNTAGVQDSVTTPEGVWTVDGNGLLTFDPVDNYNGTASITYTVQDDQGAESNSGAVSVVVSAVNDAPVATNDAIGTNPNTPVIIPVLTNDNDVDGDDLTVSLITTNPTKGSVMINPDGTITYTPNAGFINGTDSFEYRVCDTSNACDTATVTVSVPNTPLSPTANPDTNTVAEGGTVSVPTLGVLANDTDANLDGLTVVGIKIGAQTFTVGQPATIAGKGTITINSDGSYEFTALGDFNGAFPEITYTVSDGTSTADSEGTLNITVTPVNDAPVANNDAVTIDEDATATVNVATNDTDVDGAIDPSTVDLDPSSPGVQNTLTTPEGVWSVNTSGVVTFDPVDNFNGTASLPYTIKDNNGLESTTPGTITVTVNSVNDAPVATNDTVTVDEDTNATIDVTANDTDSDGTIDKTTVDLDPTTSGVQNTITTPEGVWSVDANGIVTFDPKDDFNGTASLPYNVKDNGGTISNNGTITVTVDPVNDAPVAMDDAVATNSETPVVIPVLSNDTDIDDSGLVISNITSNPAKGTVNVNPNGTITYTPDATFISGTDTFEYQVCDSSGLCDTATVTVTTPNIPLPPSANADTNTVVEGGTITVLALGLLSNDTDPNQDSLSIVEFKIGTDTYPVNQPVTIAGKGTLTINDDGSYEFTALGDFTGAFPEVVYTVTDGTGTPTDTSTLNITVSAVNDAPVIVDDMVTITEESKATINVVSNDTDVDGSIDPNTVDLDPITPGVQNTITTPEGLWTVNPSGVVTFEPVTNFTGTASLPYTVQDNNGLEATTPGTISVTVTPVDDSPAAVDDTATTTEGANVSVNVTSNDTDPDGTIDATTVDLDPSTPGQQSTITTPAGVWTVDPSGVVTLDPADNFTGTATIPYTVKDDSGLESNQGTISIIVEKDTDGDGIKDSVDLDDDNDGIPDTVEQGGNPTLDSDGDGIPNHLDLDSDGDGMTDTQEAGGTDANGDGKIDGFTDANNDGLDDATAATPLTTTNTDGTGKPDYLDVDSDGDGITDNLESQAHASYIAPKGMDTDGDGIDDAYDPDNGGTPITTPENTDGTGGPNHLDLDADDDGIVDTIEAQSTIGYQAPGVDTDGNGLADNYETTPGSGILKNAPVNSDGTDVPDYLDSDSDNDGISDSIEAYDTNGDNIADTTATGNDTDGDGIDDGYDLDAAGITSIDAATNGGQDVTGFPNDQNANTAEVDFRDDSTPASEANKDTDGDGIKDTVDKDDDNDGILDSVESLGFTPTANAADPCGFPTVNFTSPTYVAGTGLTGDGSINAQYRFENVADYGGSIGIVDAIVEITDIVGGASLLNIDKGTTGDPNAWQPEFTVPVGGNPAQMAFKVKFVLDGTSNQFNIGRIGGVIYDIDGANAQEAVILSRPGLYAIDSQSLITVNSNPSSGKVTFTGPDDTYSGVDLSPKLAAYFNYYNSSEFEIRFSANLLSATANTNLGSVLFNICGINGLFEGNTTTATPSQVNGTSEPSGPGTFPVFTVNDGIDSDADGIPNELDIDSDNDGIPDNVEAQTTSGYVVPGNSDTDGDGLLENYEGTGDQGLQAVDTDGDGTPDYLDTDSDNDGENDTIEAGLMSSNSNNDTDGDGLIDVYDDVATTGGLFDVNDDQNNGAADTANTDDPSTPEVDFREALDTDGDGIPDITDIDDDNDGIPDTVEQKGNPTLDTDGDGIPDHLDLDSDGDGVKDIVEAGGTDANNDGKIDDINPDGSLKNDTDNDGLDDAVDSDNGGTALPITDTDGDGIPDFQDTDDDGDGIDTKDEDVVTTNGNPRDDDTDGDGIPNYLDTDDDGDGVATKDEDVDTDGDLTDDDTDGDGIPNYLDDDDDGDGVDTKDEDVNNNGDSKDDDTDGDGIPNYLDTDDDGDGVDTKDEDVNNNGDSKDDDTDKDGIPNYLDTDDDGDGVDTKDEDVNNNGDSKDDDTDGDGTPNYLDTDDDGDGVDTKDEDVNNNGDSKDDDTDGDGTPNYLDTDDDGDGVDTKDEDIDKDGDSKDDDTDGDGTPNYLDTDDDGDGIDTKDEDVNNNGDSKDDDTDNDGTPNYLDTDDDGDGVDTKDEDVDKDNDATNDDTDNDGTPNYLDTDDDNDGVDTKDEDNNNDGDATNDDSDGDGTPDYLDPDDTDGDGIPDSIDIDDDNDGIPDAVEQKGDPNRDTDGDGTPDHLDLDSDGDGVKDIIEAGGIDTNNDGIVDAINPDGSLMNDTNNNGLDDSVDSANGGVSLPITDTDGDGIPNFQDVDDDNDGVDTKDEDVDKDGNPADDDSDGDGIPNYLDTDDDGDGIDTKDEDVNTNGDSKDDDTDGDGIPNYLDTDDDGDGLDTKDEDVVTTDGDPTNDDTDGDGIPNYLDTDDDNDGVDTKDEDIDNDGNSADDDSDGDGTPNYLDTDDDGDGVDTKDEDIDKDNDPKDDDSDGDGIPDYLDTDDDGDGVDTKDEDVDKDGDPENDDSDGDGVPNYLDTDDDGDGIDTKDEDIDKDGNPTDDDSDGDGTPNYLDSDDDNDGVDTKDEDVNNNGDNSDDDTDGDGIPNYLDTDDDGDGVDTKDEDVNNNGDNSDDDTDGDGTPDYLDTDDDGDGVDTKDEDVDNDGDNSNDDTDGDGIPDYLDTDDDGDGIDTKDEDIDKDGDGTNDDTDNDGIPDYLDPDVDVDSDGDGVPDNVDIDDDNDGIPDLVENGGDFTLDTDSDGIPDHLDLDSDGDGVFDLVESGSGAPDANNDGVIDGDSSAFGKNGLYDGIEVVPDSGVLIVNPIDTDGDGIRDFQDVDDDGDGIDTADEDVVTVDGDPTNDDWDGDGIPNYLDTDDDNDGTFTENESMLDCDEDGIPDHIDITDCDLVPEGFSPNGDGVNDTLIIPALADYPNFRLEVYNRWGNKVFEHDNKGKGKVTWWDGKFNVGSSINKDLGVPAGTYYYIIYFNKDNRKPIAGWVYLNR